MFVFWPEKRSILFISSFISLISAKKSYFVVVVFDLKMPVIQHQETVIFSNASLDEKVDFVYDLLPRQRLIVQFTLEYSGSLTEERAVFFKFVIAVCNTNFAVALVNAIENRIYSDISFLAIYARKLDEQLEESDIDFTCAEFIF